MKFEAQLSKGASLDLRAKDMDKSLQCSNWDERALSEEQIRSLEKNLKE